MQHTYTALITGATGGFGVELCREFARHGFELVITARDPEKLDQLARRLQIHYGVLVHPVVADLNQEAAARDLFEKTKQMGVHIDVLVNNAGFGLGGPFAANRQRLQDAMIRVNIQTLTRLCRLYLPGMLRRGRGGVLNVASIGGFVPGPYNSVYCATKAYVLSLTEALAQELRHTPLHVTAVCPGAMATGFADRAGMESTPLFRYGVMHPREVARTAYRAFVRNKTVVVAGPRNRAMMAATRIAPRRLIARVSGCIQRQR